jgi:hypothetical protein
VRRRPPADPGRDPPAGLPWGAACFFGLPHHRTLPV